MYGHYNTPLSRADFTPSPDVTVFPHLFPSSSPLPPPPHLFLPDQLAATATELDSVREALRAMNPEMTHSSSSGCSSYGSPSCATPRPSYIQRSISSHSLQPNNGLHCQFTSSWEYVDAESEPVRRVVSTGDLQHSHISDSPLSSESNAIIEGMNRACRYSPEEKKERIERYRSKRNQRNFNKKIKYACRKTLADSRPRIRGRFARNDEIEKNPELVQWSHEGGEEDEEDEDNWINFIDALSANSSIP